MMHVFRVDLPSLSNYLFLGNSTDPNYSTVQDTTVCVAGQEINQKNVHAFYSAVLW